MKLWIAISAVLIMAFPVFALEPHEGAPIVPETTTAVVLSSRDVNRISCPSPIEDLIFSSEKNVEGRYVGKDAFIKFKVARSGETLEYATQKTEFFIICNGSVYTLIATPVDDLDAVTLRLSQPKSVEIKENIRLFNAMPLDKMAALLVRQAYKGKFPSSYTVAESFRPIDVSSDLIVREAKKVTVDGIGLYLLELSVRNNKNTLNITGESVTSKAVQLRLYETDFIKAAVANNILAVSLVDQVLDPGQVTRVFVLVRKGEEAQ